MSLECRTVDCPSHDIWSGPRCVGRARKIWNNMVVFGLQCLTTVVPTVTSSETGLVPHTPSIRWNMLLTLYAVVGVA